MAQARAGLDAKKIDMALKDLSDENLGLACSVCLALPNNAVQLPRGQSFCAACAKDLKMDPHDNRTPLSSANKIPNLWARAALPLLQGLVETLAAERAAKAPAAAETQTAVYEQTLAATVAELQRLQQNQKSIDHERLQHQLTLQALRDEKAKHSAESKRMHETLKHNNRIYSERFAELHKQNEALTNEKAKIQAQKAEDEKEMQRLHTALQQRQKQKDELHAERLKLQQEKASLHAELARSKATYEETLAQHNKKIQQQTQHYLQLLREIREVVNLSKATTELQQRKLITDNSRLETEAIVLRKTIEQHIQDSDRLKAILEQITQDKRAVQAENAELQRIQAEAAANIKKLTTELAAAKADVDKLKQDLAANAKPLQAIAHPQRFSTPAPAAASQYQYRRASAPLQATVSAAEIAQVVTAPARVQLLSAQRAAASSQDVSADKKSDALKPEVILAAGATGSAAPASLTCHLATHRNRLQYRHSDGGIDQYHAQETAANRVIGTKLSLHTVLYLKADSPILTGLQNDLIALTKGMNPAQNKKFAAFIEARLIEKFKDNKKDDLSPIVNTICRAINPYFVAAEPQSKLQLH